MASGGDVSDGVGTAAVFVLIMAVWFVVKFFWWIVAGLTVVAAFYAGRKALALLEDRRAAYARRCELLATRADEQHRWVQAGDDRGIYGPDGAKLMKDLFD